MNGYMQDYDQLRQADPNVLAPALLKAVETHERVERTRRLSFQYCPDNITKEYRDSPTFPTIYQDHDLSYRAEGQQTHRLCIGDNLDALMGLSINEKGTYDLIYIDPPYNTGNKDFIYNDNFLNPEDSWKHSKWLSFMEPRLRVAKQLLKDTGVIVAAIGPQEHHHLRLMMDYIFGETNFIANITWTGETTASGRYFNDSSDYMLVYGRRVSTMVSADIKWRIPKEGAQDVLYAASSIWIDSKGEHDIAQKAFNAWWKKVPKDSPVNDHRHYNKLDESGEPYNKTPLHDPSGNGGRFDVLHPKTGLPVKVPTRGWVYSETTMQDRRSKGEVFFGEDHTTSPWRRDYLKNIMETPLRTHINLTRRGGTRRMEDILGRKAFSFPKDPTVLAKYFQAMMPKDGKVLDFFAGSGSTADAVLQLNNRDGGTRQVTLVTSNENGIGICVTRNRVVRVMSGKDWANPDKAEALGGELAVYQVGRVRLEEDVEFIESVEGKWEESPAIWHFIGEFPWAASYRDRVIGFSQSSSHKHAALALVRGEDEEAKLAFRDVIDKSNDTALLSSWAADCESYPAARTANVITPYPQIRAVEHVRHMTKSNHSYDLRFLIEEALSTVNPQEEK